MTSTSPFGESSSLYDVAPRLAHAHRGAKWERSTLDEYPGQLREIRTHRHSTGSCRECGGKTDREEFIGRMLQGCNKGTICEWYDERCRRCGFANGSNWRRPW